jgi:hypothetical protein
MKKYTDVYSGMHERNIIPRRGSMIFLRGAPQSKNSTIHFFSRKLKKNQKQKPPLQELFPDISKSYFIAGGGGGVTYHCHMLLPINF